MVRLTPSSTDVLGWRLCMQPLRNGKKHSLLVHYLRLGAGKLYVEILLVLGLVAIAAERCCFRRGVVTLVQIALCLKWVVLLKSNMNTLKISRRESLLKYRSMTSKAAWSQGPPRRRKIFKEVHDKA